MNPERTIDKTPVIKPAMAQALSVWLFWGRVMPIKFMGDLKDEVLKKTFVEIIGE